MSFWMYCHSSHSVWGLKYWHWNRFAYVHNTNFPSYAWKKYTKVAQNRAEWKNASYLPLTNLALESRDIHPQSITQFACSRQVIILAVDGLQRWSKRRTEPSPQPATKRYWSKMIEYVLINNASRLKWNATTSWAMMHWSYAIIWPGRHISNLQLPVNIPNPHKTYLSSC